MLITPVRNEEAYLELTIQAVMKQTLLPLRWVIVSDGSTDGTDRIATRYAAQHRWIEFVRMPPRDERHFAGKVESFNAGLGRVKGLGYDLVVSLDGDISFDADYFEFLIGKFERESRLGLAGTPFDEGGQTYDYRFSSLDHVSGACQVFRRECFEQIGGYMPLAGGGIDVVAVLSARMRGWQTQTFPEKVCVHHRPMGSASDRFKLRSNFKLGQRAYRLGFHPLWQLFRSLYQMTRPPYVIGGLCLSAGYFWSLVHRAERPVPKELVLFQRRDQMRRLRAFWQSRMPWHVPLPGGGESVEKRLP